jgi:hypothetical protein
LRSSTSSSAEDSSTASSAPFSSIVWHCYLSGLDSAICFPLLAIIGLSSELDLDVLFDALPDPSVIPVLTRDLEIASDASTAFALISPRLTVTAGTFEPCCRLALTALCAGLPGVDFADSAFFLGLRDLVSLHDIEPLVLFLRVVACAADIVGDGAFLFETFAEHCGDPRVPLLVLPLIYRYLISVSACPFVDDRFVDRLCYVVSEGHFRAKARALVVVKAVAERGSDELQDRVMNGSSGDDLIGLLESGEQSWVVAALQFVDWALARIRAVGDGCGVIVRWSEAGLLDCLEKIGEADPTVEVIAIRFRGIANFVL